ncbi:hypothetical protein [Sphingobacterium sp. IITKGP-BTPF85]|uniref:hypothetical protein n=1 Tax=Sphingobacterium sp. IITKGP-BTPF85 TaxID=1338009 RepID=UPI00063068AA|nr:hypothetical protein [Sphingobacterium sp. IITKGP-BTPF85]KKX52034.1 hypothetical protein L950_0201655 [Sphingobacterium sp. IITKGP-BTPF85]
MEAIDLNPIIIVTKGHAFVGCWLHQDRFAQIINEDKTAITKRFAKGISEIVVVESTSVCKGASINFNQAIDLAEASLIERNDFLLSIDIKRARASGIKPLPLKIDDSFDLEHEFIRNQVDLKMQEETIEVGKIYEEFEGNGNKSISKQKSGKESC